MREQSQSGIFAISLDFELYWGVHDSRPRYSYRDNILGSRQAIPAILTLFDQYEVHATWACVGLCFFESRRQLMQALPDRRPAYLDPMLSTYSYLNEAGATEAEDPLHFGAGLIHQMISTPGQEIGSHTFSHYYCLEPGQDVEDFRADLIAARLAAERFGVELRSLVFPRNQTNEAYLRVCRELGIIAYRGSPGFYRPQSKDQPSGLWRALRLADNYLPLSDRSRQIGPTVPGLPVNVPASCFLRPYAPAWAPLDSLRLRRICAEMEKSAIEGRLYHVWWHPHNFGMHLHENLSFLERILKRYADLRCEHGMLTLNMGEIAQRHGITAPLGEHEPAHPLVGG